MTTLVVNTPDGKQHFGADGCEIGQSGDLKLYIMADNPDRHCVAAFSHGNWISVREMLPEK